MSRSIEYGNLMHDAMRGLIRKVLQDVADHGLPGAHHFFITFDTGHPDAELADWLSDRYPDEMTVVVQHWYDNLEVTDDGFSITLNFGDAPEPLYIPYDAIKTFVDPSVEFGLRFETQDSDAEDDEAEDPAAPAHLPAVKPKGKKLKPDETKSTSDKEDEAGVKDAEIVSLDSFRK
ncbi:SspB family protein [Sulfitobacter sabulilitoris]|uniref:Stringent starvation protein B n=1 Tax=Sulfitobacter sabulilitoris TaxID=2562655 RepID=A0A5S3PJU9_9RHOB|nr:ClpXP protease specificity-enhancing factor SspB [Sulfitobacter sabulilitoris]TMM54694.1 hypothetical protein FDT80_03680 [Sulfitobacter sabulilitoris]